jgi:hypothetical protein
VRIHLARPDEAVQLWPQVEKALSGTLALVKDTHLPTDVLAAILTGGMQLFVALDGLTVKGACVGHFMQYPRIKAYVTFLVGGEEMRSWINDMAAATEQFARSQGCTRMDAGGRKGWVRAAGYEEVGTMLRKGL